MPSNERRFITYAHPYRDFVPKSELRLDTQLRSRINAPRFDSFRVRQSPPPCRFASGTFPSEIAHGRRGRSVETTVTDPSAVCAGATLIRTIEAECETNSAKS